MLSGLVIARKHHITSYEHGGGEINVNPAKSRMLGYIEPCECAVQGASKGFPLAQVFKTKNMLLHAIHNARS